MDDFVYNYLNEDNDNRLNSVHDAAGDSEFGGVDISSGQIENNYKYDLIGQLVSDEQEGIKEIKWKVNNKVEEVIYYSGKRIEFKYDALGNRIAKKVWTTSTATPDITYYVLDAQGNPMSTYKGEYQSSGGGSGFNLYLSERNLYGSSRVGVENLKLKMNEPYTYPTHRYAMNNTTGDKYYELSNHLGNVLNVVTDRKIPIDSDNNGIVDYYTADVIGYADYYPFGMLMPGRHGGTLGRYAFNSMEKDDEIKIIEGSSYDFGARMYDPRIGRFLSLDKKMMNYPFMSPYCFAANSPIRLIDVNGDGPGDPVVYSSTTAKKGNVIVYLVEPGQGFQKPDADVLKNWDIIVVTKLENASAIIEKTYGNTNSINNLIIDTHGNGRGALLLEESEGITDLNATPNDKYIIDGRRLKHDRSRKVFEGLTKNLKENAKILLVGCGVGKDDELAKNFLDLATKNSNINNVAIYTNEGSSVTNTVENNKDVKLIFNESIDDQYNSDSSEWVKTHDDKNGVPKKEKLGNKEPILSSKGGIKWKEKPKAD
jgi:RHS repeat-associated protein